MHIVFFTHPLFLSHKSMPRYANWLASGMEKRGHSVELWTAAPQMFNLPVPNAFKKWMGYIDQYILFPKEVKKKLKSLPKDTLFVVTDHALGPWVPYISDRNHVIHCHDFLAQKSALGQIEEVATKWSGKKYQQFIRSGYQKGKNFISVSKKTRSDLDQFLSHIPEVSEVVYNGVNDIYKVIDHQESRQVISNAIGLDVADGYLLHVGGNQWYKNRKGVVEIYNAWRQVDKGGAMPLLLIGEPPSDELKRLSAESKYKNDIHFFSNITDKVLVHLYNGARAFLFPSLAEGFGWPIAEAMACGCPVLTTNQEPMTEVGNDAAFYVPKRPVHPADVPEWAAIAALKLDEVLQLTADEFQLARLKGLNNVQRFDSAVALNQIEAVYKKVLNQA